VIDGQVVVRPMMYIALTYDPASSTAVKPCSSWMTVKQCSRIRHAWCSAYERPLRVIVIGSGPAGYPAAIRAAQNKLKVACIDEWKKHRRVLRSAERA